MKIDIFTHVMLPRYKEGLYDVENGGVSIRETIKAIEAMAVSDSVRKKIYEGNERRLFRL